MNIELFCCSGGMAAGFREAGILFDVAVDASQDACDSYEKNLGHRPLQMRAEDFLRVVKAGGWATRVNLLVADPPCTPWSRAGKRQGLDDDRDALGVTIDIIRTLKPRVWLIGNVPGLDDGCNLDSVHATIGTLTRDGYCVADYARLDAANYGVPQHRIRPFWYGHAQGTPCLKWPTPTHGDPTPLGHAALGETRKPWMTCREALATLPRELWGAQVRLVRKPRLDQSHRDASGRPTPGRTVAAVPRSQGEVLVIRDNHPTADEDKPARTLTASTSTAGSDVLALRDRDDGSVREMAIDEPATTIRAGRSSPERMITDGDATLIIDEYHSAAKLDAPAFVVGSKAERTNGGGALVEAPLEWPWERPATTIQRDERLGAPGHKDENWLAPDGSRARSPAQWMDERPSTVITTRNGQTAPPGHHPEHSLLLPGAVVLSEEAAMRLQAFPEGWVLVGKTKRARWGMLGQAMPAPLAAAVARQIAAWLATHGGAT